MFTIKSLLYLTAVIAALSLMLRETRGDTSAGAAGLVMYVALIGWWLVRHRKADKAMVTDASEQEKPRN